MNRFLRRRIRHAGGQVWDQFFNLAFYPPADNLGHLHHQAEPGILKDHIFHKPSHVYNADNLDIADIGKLFIYSGSRLQWAFLDPNRTDAFGTAQAGINRQNKRLGIFGVDMINGILEVYRMNRVIQRAVNHGVLKIHVLELSPDQGSQTIAGGTVRSDT